MDNNFEIITDERSNDGLLSVIIYFDSNANVCSKENAKTAMIRTSDKNGNIISTSYCRIKKHIE